MNTAYIGIGSNQQSPVEQIRTAIATLEANPHIQQVTASRLYHSTPVGPQDQPDYVNGALAITTALDAHALLDLLQSIENQQGRVRTRRWGPRTLDLDILLFNQQCIDSARLNVPHVEMFNRSFVLIPLAELLSEITLEGTRINIADEAAKHPPLQQVTR